MSFQEKSGFSISPWAALEHELYLRVCSVLRWGGWAIIPPHLTVIDRKLMYNLSVISNREGSSWLRTMTQRRVQKWALINQHPRQMQDECVSLVKGMWMGYHQHKPQWWWWRSWRHHFGAAMMIHVPEKQKKSQKWEGNDLEVQKEAGVRNYVVWGRDWEREKREKKEEKEKEGRRKGRRAGGGERRRDKKEVEGGK